MKNRSITPKTEGNINEHVEKFKAEVDKAVSKCQQAGDVLARMVDEEGEENAFNSIQEKNPTISRSYLVIMLKVGRKTLAPDSKEALDAMLGKIEAETDN